VPQHTADYTKEAYSHPTWRGSRHGIALRLLPPSSAVDLTSTTRNPMTEILQSPAAMIRPNIPFRLDRLPWSRFHLLEHFPTGMNRLGFPKRRESDSSWMLAREVSMHDQGAFR
jgi:hypothetical protein